MINKQIEAVARAISRSDLVIDQTHQQIEHHYLAYEEGWKINAKTAWNAVIDELIKMDWPIDTTGMYTMMESRRGEVTGKAMLKKIIKCSDDNKVEPPPPPPTPPDDRLLREDYVPVK